MKKRRFAKDTVVPIAKSRGEIDQLLRQWGCDAIQWTDEFSADRVTLRFAWHHDDIKYMARFAVHLEPIRDEDILDGRSKLPSPAKRAKAEAARGKREHRLLLLWLKAALNAVDAGIIDAATLFLPFLEDSMGKTIAEIAVPKLAQLPAGKVAGLLGL